MDSIPRSSGSTKEQEPSSLSNLRTNHSISKVLENKRTSKCGPLTVDGGKSSNIRKTTSSILVTSCALMSLEPRMLKARMYKSGRDTMVPTKDGRSSILMKISKLTKMKN